jgi:beta-phosphoglucomutase-like phosphatase (HAD superfamily)
MILGDKLILEAQDSKFITFGLYDRSGFSSFRFLSTFVASIKKTMLYDKKPGVEGLIFDLDGTLVDSMPIHFEGWKKACERFGAFIDPAFLRLHTGSPAWAIAEAIIENSGLDGRITPEQIINVKLEEFRKTQYMIKPIEPVADIVRKYFGKLPMAIGTGGHREAVERTLEVTGMRQYFDIIVTSNDVMQHKPHPETFLKCAVQMKLDPQFIEVFEDGDLGLEAAQRAGMISTDVRTWYPSF